MLLISRLDPDGRPDATFSERGVSGPAVHVQTALAEDGQGGFVALMQRTTQSTSPATVITLTTPFALMRVTGNGDLAQGFGTGGLLFSTDLGVPFGLSTSVVHRPGGGWFVATNAVADSQATPAAGSVFMGWLGACIGTATCIAGSDPYFRFFVPLGVNAIGFVHRGLRQQQLVKISTDQHSECATTHPHLFMENSQILARMALAANSCGDWRAWQRSTHA